jgi:excisionase family DNA binding protein
MSDQETDRTNKQPLLNELITFTEAARLSGFTDRHLRKLASQNKLWSIKLGRNWFTTAQAVNDYMETEHKPGPKPLKADK